MLHRGLRFSKRESYFLNFLFNYTPKQSLEYQRYYRINRLLFRASGMANRNIQLNNIKLYM